MSIKRIDIISIPVSDQARSKDFYVDKLGFAVKRDNPMGPDQRWVELVTAEGETSISLVHWFDKMPPGCAQGIVIGTDDIAKTQAELAARGVEIGPVEAQPWGTFATFSDPDGNGWVLQQAAPEG